MEDLLRELTHANRAVATLVYWQSLLLIVSTLAQPVWIWLLARHLDRSAAHLAHLIHGRPQS